MRCCPAVRDLRCGLHRHADLALFNNGYRRDEGDGRSHNGTLLPLPVRSCLNGRHRIRHRQGFDKRGIVFGTILFLFLVIPQFWLLYTSMDYPTGFYISAVLSGIIAYPLMGIA